MDRFSEINPFVIKGYISKEYFCDRKRELDLLLDNIAGNSDTTLISDRRLGKTGLIFRLMEEIHDRKLPIDTVNIDIYSTRSLSDFIRVLSEAVFAAYPERTSTGEKFLRLIKSLRPQLSFDPLTGAPQFSINYQNTEEKEQTLKGLLNFLEGRERRVLLTIDEFQQIREYPEKNTEALLRTYTQNFKNVSFIFCGSRKHIMTDMFANSRSPFYSSTRFLTLDKIDGQEYCSFITEMFNAGGKRISQEAVDFILDWTLRHTFYTQSVCHSVFAENRNEVSLADVKSVCGTILKLNEPVYLQYRSMLSANQWNYLIAMAKEGENSHPQSKDFLMKYGIGSASSSARLAEALLEKGLIIDRNEKENTSYRVYDVFLMRWLQNTY